MKKIFLIFILNCILFSLPIVLLAKTTASDCSQYCADPINYDPPSNMACVCNPLNTGNFEDIINNIINFILRIGIVLAPLMIIIGGFLFITAGGSVQRVDQAKKLILWTIVGFMILLLAKGILEMVKRIIGIQG